MLFKKCENVVLPPGCQYFGSNLFLVISGNKTNFASAIQEKGLKVCSMVEHDSPDLLIAVDIAE